MFNKATAIHNHFHACSGMMTRVVEHSRRYGSNGFGNRSAEISKSSRRLAINERLDVGPKTIIHRRQIQRARRPLSRKSTADNTIAEMITVIML